MTYPEINRYPIAVDLSDGLEAVALQLAAGRGRPTVRAAIRQRLSTDTRAPDVDAAEVAFIKEALRNPATKGRSIALIPPSDSIHSYPLHVVVAKGETLETAIVREADSALDAPLEEMVIDFSSVQPLQGGGPAAHEVLLVAMRKHDVDRHLDLVKQAGGVLESIEGTATALVRAHRDCAPLSSRPTLLCNIGRLHSEIVVATTDSIAAHRSIPWGTERLMHKLIENLQLGEGERDANFLLHNHGLSLGDATHEPEYDTVPDATSGTVSQLLIPLVDGLVHELHNIIGYIRSRNPGVAFGGAYLYHEGARIKGLDRYLEEAVGVTVKVAEPFASIAMPGNLTAVLSSEGPLFTLGLGLGLRRVRWL